jgi:hypothetical protein
MPLAEGIDRTLRWHIDDLPTTARLRRQAAGESMP